MTKLLSQTIVELNDSHAPGCLRLAASLAAKIASDLGARVIKIEPPGGDIVRRMPPYLQGTGADERSALFQFLNTGKESLVLDLESNSGREILGRVLAGADGVIREVEGEEDALRSYVTVVLSGFGDRTSRVGEPFSELSIMALGGLLDMIGDPEREPLRLGGHQAAYAAGLAAFTAMMAGLTKNADEPRDYCVSLLDVMIWLNWKAPAGALFLGRPPSREGAQAEWRTIACADGHLALVYADRDWPALCKLARSPVLAAPPFDTPAGRRTNRLRVVELLETAFASRSRAEIFAEAKAARIPLGPVLSPLELIEDEQYLARDFLATLEHATFGSLVMPHVPASWNGQRFAPRPAPRIDQNNGSFR